jgi:EmrB/QacA subfamily drug resistance transporter
MVDAYLLVYAGLILTMGTLGDRFGRKLALQTGLALFGGGSLAVLAVGTSGQLIAVRAVMGVGGALIMPATLSIISNVFPVEERQKAIGIWAGMASIGIGLGPLFGGLLLEYFDWRSVFMVNVPITAIAFAIGMRLVPESRDPEPGAFDLVGAALSVAALLALVFPIIEAPDWGWTDTRVLGCFAAAAVLGVAFARWELRTPEPMLNLSFLRSPRFSVASLAISLASFALFGAIFANTQFLQDAMGYSALRAGAAMTPLALGLVVGAISATKAVERLGTTPVVVTGLLGLAGLLGSSLVWTPDMPYAPLGVWFLLTACAMGWILGPATASVMGSIPESKAGVGSAMNDVTRQVGGALGTAVIGSLVSSLYASKVAGSVAALPETARTAVEDSIGRANAVAASMPSGGGQVSDAAARAFTDAMGIGFAVAAGCAVIAALLAWRWLPARDGAAADIALPAGIAPQQGAA